MKDLLRTHPIPQADFDDDLPFLLIKKSAERLRIEILVKGFKIQNLIDNLPLKLLDFSCLAKTAQIRVRKGLRQTKQILGTLIGLLIFHHRDGKNRLLKKPFLLRDPMEGREFIGLKLRRIDEQKGSRDQISNEGSMVHDGCCNLHEGVATGPDRSFSPSDRFTDSLLVDRSTESLFFPFSMGEMTEEILALADG
jgi:hypothetical protein